LADPKVIPSVLSQVLGISWDLAAAQRIENVLLLERMLGLNRRGRPVGKLMPWLGWPSVSCPEHSARPEVVV
jgi:hypothetical protein